MVTRRAVLTTGAASIVVAGLGGTWWFSTAPGKTAREPWRRAAEGFGDPRLDVLAYAILAPNPHNMQPWRVELNASRRFTVYCDTDRLLPETDPPGRQITIGFGCFLELCRQAAAEAGYRARFTYFPEGEPVDRLDDRPVATVALVEDATVKRDPLFSTVLARRTNRLEYDMSRPVSRDTLDRLQAASVEGVRVAGTADENTVDALKTLAANAWAVEWATPETRRESIAVSRIGGAAVNANPYGLALDDRASSTLGLVGMMTREAMDDPDSTGYRESLKFYTRACLSSPAFVWSTTADNSRRAQLEAGRAWVRVQLAANAAGLSFHPLSQALQEFPAMAQHYRRAHELLAEAPGETVQMLARVGYGKSVGPAPREPLESKLVT